MNKLFVITHQAGFFSYKIQKVKIELLFLVMTNEIPHKKKFLTFDIYVITHQKEKIYKI